MTVKSISSEDAPSQSHNVKGVSQQQNSLTEMDCPTQTTRTQEAANTKASGKQPQSAQSVQNDSAKDSERVDPPQAEPEKKLKTSRGPKKRSRHGPSQQNRSGIAANNGSYRNYYDRRHEGEQGDDRLPIIREACALQGQIISILDIGCNNGTVTMDIASMNRCAEVVGVDLDSNLIGAARKKIRELVSKKAKQRNAKFLDPLLPGSLLTSDSSVFASLIGKEVMIEEGKSFAQFPWNITFRREDFAQAAPTRTSLEKGKYDIAMCLSVTKWIHLGGGDEALKRTFHRLYECLKPDGVLILEPQQKKSYKSAIRKGLGEKDVKGERKLKPHMFQDYLINTVHFGRMRMLRDLHVKGKAFNRPIMAFYKSSINPSDEVHVAEAEGISNTKKRPSSSQDVEEVKPASKKLKTAKEN